MKKEIRTFFTALMFLTRLPCPQTTDHSQAYLQKAPKYFPLVGAIVGAISGAVFWVASLGVSAGLALFFSMIAGVLTTGAFHEDGFADVCDAFGGGWTKEKILEIMKDSRLGSYGATGLILVLMTKFLLLCEILRVIPTTPFPKIFQHNVHASMVVLLVCAHAMSRLMAVTFLYTHEYVGNAGTKSKPVASQKLSTAHLSLATVFGIAPVFLFNQPWLFLTMFPCYLAKWWLGQYFSKWIGGYTGDCLGATQQVCEIVFYLACLIIWKFT